MKSNPQFTSLVRIVPGSARNWRAVNNQPEQEMKTKNVTTLHLRKSISRSPLRRGFPVIALVLLCFAFMPAAQATDQRNPDPLRRAFAFHPFTNNIRLGSDRGVSSTAPLGCVDWEVVQSPNAGTVNDQLLAATAISDNNVWAAGWYYQGNAVLTLTEHWNGTIWSIVSSPNLNGSGELYGITAVASNDVWAVGFSNGSTLILHWDGMNWSVVHSANPHVYNRLFEVHAVSANDVWAVGTASDCQNCASYTLTEHWDGTSWTSVPSPNVGFLNGLTALAVTPGFVWAAGNYNACDLCPAQTLTIRWDGSTWKVVASPNVGSGSNYIDRMSAIPSAATSRAVWAVGFYYDQGNTPPERTLALYWDGSQWSIVPTPNGSGGTALGGVGAVAANDVWAVGSTNIEGDTIKTWVQQWDGTSWTIVPSQNAGTAENGLNYVAVTPTGNSWAVGAYYNTPYSYRTLVERAVYNCGTK